MKINMPEDVRFIIKTLNNNNYKGYIVGGCVRDSILNRIPKDWDITTDCKPLEIISIFKSLGYDVIETGLKHGTLTVIISNIRYEITTFRIDGKSADHRHSDEVIFVDDIIKDLSRRDFTINSIAYDDLDGLLDPFNGLKDISDGIIKCVGNPSERFNEDSLRMLRAIRFASQLGFTIEQNTMNAICNQYETLQFISKERIREELCKILISNNPVNGIRLLSDSELIKYIIPQLEKCIGFEQNNKHHDKTVYEHILSVVDNTPNKLDIRLSALLHDIGKPECYSVGEDGQGHFYKHHIISSSITQNVLKDLKFDNNTINKVSILVREHMSRYDHLRTPNIKKFINRVGIENLDNLFELQIADIKGSSKRSEDFDNINLLKEQCYKILNEKQPLTIKDLVINGNDLIAMGYKQGKELGKKLNEIMELVLEEKEPNNRERLLELLKM